MKLLLKRIPPLVLLMFMSYLSNAQSYAEVELNGAYVKKIYSDSKFERFKFRYVIGKGEYLLSIQAFYKGRKPDAPIILTSTGANPAAIQNNGLGSIIHLTSKMMKAHGMDGSCTSYTLTPKQLVHHGKKYVSYHVAGVECLAFTDFDMDPSPPATVPLVVASHKKKRP